MSVGSDHLGKLAYIFKEHIKIISAIFRDIDWKWFSGDVACQWEFYMFPCLG